MVARLPQSQSRRLVVPEVIQSSAMDCGPATLKAILEGYEIDASYGRLREACQTDVDGTSIDSLEELAQQLGLDAEQIMVPRDHLLVPEARTLPAIVVTRLPNGSTHFVVLWRRHGRYLQVMDPSIGRRWVNTRDFLEEVYVHSFAVPAAAWREWAASDEFLAVLARRLDRLGVSQEAAAKLVEEALEDPSWSSIAQLDAAVRMTDSLVHAGGLRKGEQATGALEAVAPEAIPETYWSVRLAAGGKAAQAAGEGQVQGQTEDEVEAQIADQARAEGQAEGHAEPEEELTLRGALLIRVLGRKDESDGEAESGAALSENLSAAIRSGEAKPGRALLELLRQDGFFVPSVLVSALAVAAGGLLVEALLLRSLLDAGLRLELSAQRLGAVAAIALLAFTLLLLDLPVTHGLLRVGRRLEMRLRMAFLRKLPALGDRYFSSRLSSDMAERSHAIHQMRSVSPLIGEGLRAVFELVLVTAGIVWLDPGSAPWAILAAAGALAVPLLSHRSLVERDLRLRSHTGALSRFYLDGLLGLVPIRAHSAEPVVRREHESLVSEWSRAGLRLQRLVASVQGWQLFIGFSLVAVLVVSHLERAASAGTVLLLVYWALRLPGLGQEIAVLWSRYPWQRNVTLRLLEPLGAPSEEVEQHGRAAEPATAATGGPIPAASGGAAVAMSGVGVVAGGHAILRQVDLSIAPGEHVAIVGPSGAGKSTLVGLLLGWNEPAAGELRVDGGTLDEAALELLRRWTVWVDPSVRLWNRSLVENLRYGASQSDGFGPVIEEALLKEVLESLPDGMQTSLGEGGGLVSGGEGQRVRLGRGMMRSDARLVILDEPFRGLDRRDRNLLLRRCRRWWSEATVLFVTHDVRQGLDFDRVVVMEGGRVVEQGDPASLARRNGRYRALLEAEERALEGLWRGAGWRRLWLEGGRLGEAPVSAGEA